MNCVMCQKEIVTPVGLGGRCCSDSCFRDYDAEETIERWQDERFVEGDTWND